MINKSNKPRILVLGIGGGGTNAVNNMLELKLRGVDFLVANTDVQALNLSKVNDRIILGSSFTKGLGTGSDPNMGRIATEESLNKISNILENYNMMFITAGMGGGTGTGGAPVIARLAKEKKILTIGIVTKPFFFEGVKKMQIAELGLIELEKHLDILTIIPNQNLFRLANEKTTILNIFKLADKILYESIKSITDLINVPGLINLDFADIDFILRDGGKAMIGIGESEGKNRSINAAESAIINPLLENSYAQGAKKILVNVTGGKDISLFEIDESINRIKEEIDNNADIVFGSTLDVSLNTRIKISIFATGIISEVNRNIINSFRIKTKQEDNILDIPAILRNNDN